MKRKPIHKNLELDRSFSLSTHVCQSLTDRDEWETYILEVKGSITYEDYGAGGIVSGGEAGRITAYWLRIDAAIDAGEPVEDIFDSHSQWVYDAFSEAIDPKTLEVRETIQELMDFELWGNDIFYLDKVEILPAYRGRGIGVLAVRQLLEMYGHLCSFAITNPYPMYPKAKKELRKTGLGDPAWFKAMEYAKFKAPDRIAAKKLSRLWGQVGFRQIPGSAWHIWRQFPTDPSLGKKETVDT